MKLPKLWNGLHDQSVMDVNSGHIWDVDDLIRESKGLRVEKVKIRHLNLYDESFTADTLPMFVAHMKKVEEADLSYPIILGDQGQILDGRHRLAKALLKGKKYIKAVRFDTNPPYTTYNLMITLVWGELDYPDNICTYSTCHRKFVGLKRGGVRPNIAIIHDEEMGDDEVRRRIYPILSHTGGSSVVVNGEVVEQI